MIVKLILKGYIPLNTKGVEYFETDQLGLMNILIGRNGHGKSSILNEASPMPPENADYVEDGYKYVEIINKGKRYYLESFTGSKSKHSFKDSEGNELNSGGTQAAQKELVKQYFDLTPLYFKVLTAINENYRFTALGVAERKFLLMDLYPNDTKYALIVYNKIKSAYSDTVGALKNQSQRLIEEQQRVSALGGKTKEELLHDISQLDKRINEIVYLQGELNGTANVSGDLRLEIEDFNSKVKSLLVMGMTTGTLSRQQLIASIESLKASLVYHETQQKMYQTQLNDISSAMSGLELKDHDPKQFETQLLDLEYRHAVLETVLNDSEELIKREPFICEHRERLINLAPGFRTLIDRINLIPLCSNPELTTSQYQNWLDKSEQIFNEGKQSRVELEHVQHQLKHYRDASEVQCPECSSQFKPGFDKTYESKLIKQEDGLKSTIAHLTSKYKQYKQTLALDQEWFSQMRALEQYVESSHEAKFLLHLLSEYKVGYEPADRLINIIKTLATTLDYKKQQDALTEEINVLKTRINVFKTNNMEEALAAYSLSEERLGDSNRAIRRCMTLMREHQKTLKDYDAYEITIDAIREGQARILDLLRDEGKVSLHRRLNEVMSSLLPQKDEVMSLMIRQESLKTLVESIEDNIAGLKKRQSDLKILMDGLCPKKGYIGELMKDFITAICANMNAVIRDIWSTPLFVKPCVNKKGEMDYNFPVINGDSSRTASDVAKCSGGEKEIINFAFRLVVSRYVKYDSPLFLDEVGVNMDEYHRGRFFDYVKRLMATGKIDQCFMISHYSSQYGLMDNANIIALNTEGLTVPPNVNLSTTIR